MNESVASIPTVDVAVPAPLHAKLLASAEKMGLSLSSYLELLQAIQAGQVSPDLIGAVREVFTHDREILRELAK